jgi:NTE family protein
MDERGATPEPGDTPEPDAVPETAGPSMPDDVPEEGVDEGAADPSVVRRGSTRGPRDGVAICLSGGGSRAMLFHAGAILRLAEVGLLDGVRLVSSVSGGSITAGVLAQAWAAGGVPDPGAVRARVIQPLLDLSRRFIDIPAFVGGTLIPGSTPGERFAGALARHLYGDATLGALPATPEFVFNATNLGSGALWRFSRDFVGDYLVGGGARPDIPLSAAVAASCAFPPFFAPFRLRFPATAAWPVDGRLGRPEYRTRIDLGDGGIYDNLGLETAWKAFRTVVVSDGGGAYQPSPRPPGDPLRLTLRVTQTIDHQVRSLRRRQIMSGFKHRPPTRHGTFWGIATHIADYEVPALLPVDQRRADRLAAVGTHMRGLKPGVARGLVNWGYAISDAALRRYLLGADPPLPAWPFPDQPLG